MLHANYAIDYIIAIDYDDLVFLDPSAISHIGVSLHLRTYIGLVNVLPEALDFRNNASRKIHKIVFSNLSTFEHSLLCSLKHMLSKLNLFGRYQEFGREQAILVVSHRVAHSIDQIFDYCVVNVAKNEKGCSFGRSVLSLCDKTR